MFASFVGSKVKSTSQSELIMNVARVVQKEAKTFIGKNLSMQWNGRSWHKSFGKHRDN